MKDTNEMVDGNEATPPLEPTPKLEEASGTSVSTNGSMWDDAEVDEGPLPEEFNELTSVEEPPVATPTIPEPEKEIEVAEKELDEPEEAIYPVTDDMLKIANDVYKLVDPKNTKPVGLVIFPTTRDDFNTKTEHLTEDETSMTAEDLPFLLSAHEGQDTSYPGEGLIKTTTRIGSKWRQYLTTPDNSNPLGPRRNKFAMTKEQGAVVSGNSAVDAFMAGTTLGRSVQVPLWHSGFWVTLRAPSGAYLAEIDRALAFSREEIGLDTNGAVGSNDPLVFDEVLIDAALKLVTASTLPFSKNPLELKEFIAKNDIPLLIWGMAMAAFPEGTMVAIPCPSCKNISTVVANPLRMFWVDESRFTAKQISLMGRASRIQTKVEDLVAYQEEFEILNTSSWEWNGRVFYFNDPSVDEYLGKGRDWIGSINRALAESLREDYDDVDRRTAAIQSILSTEDLCRFAHYIKEIKIPSGDEGGYFLVNDQPTIIDLLRQLSADGTAAASLQTAIGDYVTDSIGAIVGYPNVACSACGKFHLNEKGESTIIVPFNPGTGFFILAQHRIRESGGIPLTSLKTLGVSGLEARVSGRGVPV